VVPLDLAAGGQMPNGLLHGSQATLDLPHPLDQIKIGQMGHGIDLPAISIAIALPIDLGIGGFLTVRCRVGSIWHRVDEHQEL